MKEFISRLKTLQSKAAELEAKQPFHLNVIDELHASENAHTRILGRILQFKQNDRMPFLESFLGKVLHVSETLGPDLTIVHNQEFIDLLIEDRRSGFAIIVENKIHDAGDQDRQLERYIDAVKAHGAERIYAAYLTADGTKRVSDISLTAQAKRALGWISDDEPGRLALINYRYDILPWLRDEVVGSCPHREEKMIAGIVQYIDHLEGKFGMRKDQEKTTEELLSFISSEFGIEGATAEDFAKIAELEKLAAQFSDLLEKLKMQKAESGMSQMPEAQRSQFVAKKLRSRLEQQSIVPFSSLWIYNGDTVVLEGWKRSNATLALDINCAVPGRRGISLAIRGIKRGEYLKKAPEDVIEALQKLGFTYAENKGRRYMKPLPEAADEAGFSSLLEAVSGIVSALAKMTEN